MSTRVILNADEMRRALNRMAHEIVEQNGGVERLILLGLRSRGVPLAHRIREAIERFEQAQVPCGELDITLYRDDLLSGGVRPVQESFLPTDVTDMTVVLVDDVLYTGRTIRAALDAVMDYGRPRAIELAVLVDRGHRELPIRANYVGKNVPSSRDEQVSVRVKEIDDEDEVVIGRGDEELQGGTWRSVS